MYRRVLLSLACSVLICTCAFAIEPNVIGPNTDPIYQQLRRPALGEAVTVSKVVLKRDAGTFTLDSGTLCFLAPINGKVTGAVFSGSGMFTLMPPTPFERKSVSYLTKADPNNGLTEEFSELALRFTDGTYEQLKKANGVTATQATCDAGPLEDALNTQRRRVNSNLVGRMLQDVLSTEPGGYFAAFIKGKKYGKSLYVVDPHGLELPIMLAPEEVVFMTFDYMKEGTWATFHLAEEYANATASSAQRNDWFQITNQKLDIGIEKGGKLNGKATTTITSSTNGLRVLPLSLFSRLRVSAVSDGSGNPLAFIQEDKDEDPDFYVILPKAVNKGESYSITTTYSGKDALYNEGGGNYLPIARSTWFPNTPRDGNYTNYEMRFTYPKGLTLISTGALVSEKNENGQMVAEWKSEAPITVAGFHLGRWKKESKKLDRIADGSFDVEAYTNTEVPDNVKALQNAIDNDQISGVAMGTMQTTSMGKRALAEAELSVKVYNDYFGPLPFKRMAVTQQAAMDFGQAWPGLVWLPMSYFYDSTVRHQLGFRNTRGYFNTVEPHEIAHQWWGHAVTWGSYRDQWMSEGFSEFAASVFLQLTRGQNDFIKFWNDERELLTEKTEKGMRPIDVGPLTLGYRLDTSKTGVNVTRNLIYPKGGYILHMIRMMMWDRKAGDEAFKVMMRDFTKTYTNKPATTEDFKATVEKHMTPAMDFVGDRKMDWFFNQYVYGTALPNYKFDYTLSDSAEGPLLKMSVTQSNVDPTFRMFVPIYLEMADGKVLRLGSVGLIGNDTQSTTVPLKGFNQKPKRVVINYYNDVLCTMS